MSGSVKFIHPLNKPRERKYNIFAITVDLFKITTHVLHYKYTATAEVMLVETSHSPCRINIQGGSSVELVSSTVHHIQI